MPILVAIQEIVRDLVFCIPDDIDLENKNQVKHYEVRGDRLYIDFVDQQRKSIDIAYTANFGGEDEFITMPILVAIQEIVRNLEFCIPDDIDLENKNQVKHYEVRGDRLYIDFVDQQRKSIDIAYEFLTEFLKENKND